MIGTVEALWRYPVKSMRGEELPELFLSYAGVYGDRLFAFRSVATHHGFPFLTGREKRKMILYRPRFRHPEKAARPVNFEEAAKLSPLINPVSASAAELMLDVETPNGETFAIDDPALIEDLQADTPDEHELTLHRSDKAITDCCPLSLISLQSVAKLGEESGGAVDKRRFRANIYMNLRSADGFSEDALVGKSLRIGTKVIVQVVARDARCMMIALDPKTAEKTPAVLKAVARRHDNTAGVYAAVLSEGLIRKGDSIEQIEPA